MNRLLKPLTIALFSLMASTSFAAKTVSCYESRNPNNTISFSYSLQTSQILVTYENHAMLLPPLRTFTVLTSNGVRTVFERFERINPGQGVLVLDEKNGTLTWNTAAEVVFDVCKVK
jgi:hypothetical protein